MNVGFLKRAAFAAAVALLSVGSANAAILAQSTPASTEMLLEPLSNNDDFQQFLVKITLPNAAVLRGFGIFTGPVWQGQEDVVIHLRDDVGGAPAANDLVTLNEELDQFFYYESGGPRPEFITYTAAHFSPLALAAGTYWIGMTGEGGNDIGWSGWGPYGVAEQYWRYFDGPFEPIRMETLAWVLEGEFLTSAIPEPATWVMMILGFGAVGAMVRTSNRRKAFSPV